MSELYDRIGERTLELLQVNQRLNIETEQRKRAEEGLQLAAIVFANVNEAVMVTGANNCIIAVNPSFTRITGYASDEVISRNPSMLSGGINPPEFYQDLWRSLEATGKWEGEIRNRRKSGEFYVEWLSINRVRSETAHGITHHVGVFYDVTNRRAEADRIQRMAHYDLITSLPNRALLEDRAHQTIAKAVRDGTRLAVMFLDLDRFKRVNDTHGHSIGDRLLNEAAVRLQACLRASDTVARIGGDEFVVLLPEVEAVANAMTVAQKMRESLNQPFEFDGKYLHISCSIGIALFPGDGINEKQLIEKADAAMYRAKKSGRNRVEPYPRGATEFVK